MPARALIPALFVLLSFRATPAQTQGGKAARDVLEAMAQKYAAARSYQDEGEVRTIFMQGDRRSELVRPFRTDFVRPRHFHYRFTEDDPDGEPKLFVVWTDEAPRRASRWWTVQPEVRRDTLELSVAGGKGISGGSAIQVPPLLMPDAFRGASLASLKEPVLDEAADVDGVTCDTVRGRSPQDEPVTVWIGKDDHLIRKVHVAHDFGDFKSQETTTYRPQVDVPITADTFRFQPPK